MLAALGCDRSLAGGALLLIVGSVESDSGSGMATGGFFKILPPSTVLVGGFVPEKGRIFN